MLLFTQNPLINAPFDPWAAPKFYVSLADVIIKGLALFVGAMWTLNTYIKGRTYSKRIEATLTGKIVTAHQERFILVSCETKNSGLSKLEFVAEGSSCRLYVVGSGDPYPSTQSSRPVAAFSIYKDHQWIEPGETAVHQEMFLLRAFPGPVYGVKIAVRVTVKLELEQENIVRHEHRIITIDDDPPAPEVGEQVRQV